ncbi:MAG TPA: chromate resistance protein ChrB domain-containing protein [Candidatus Binatia bacterium]|jgi:hypothetical protein
MQPDSAAPWLVLLHQLPPKPPYLRVKVWRRLQALGAISLKNSVYALPNTAECREDFEWLLREIHKDGGEASLCEARLVDGLSDDEVRTAFRRAREEDYRALAREARELARTHLGARRGLTAAQRTALGGAVDRLRKRLEDLGRIDFFEAPGRESVDGLLDGLAKRTSDADAGPSVDGWRVEDVQRRVWVTRKGIHIDRIASAWLVRRFIDPEARFKFVPAKGYRPARGELRFDMFEAEFTHQGDLCTFEVLLRAFGLADPALAHLAAVIHDIDLKDGKFAAAETAGVDHLVAGIAWLHPEDEARLADGGRLFDALYEYARHRK